jgi:hypothetical protein
MLVAIKEIVATDKDKRDQLLNDLRTFLTGSMSQFVVDFYGCYYHAGVVKLVLEYMNLGSLKNITDLVTKKKVHIDEKHLAEMIRRVNHIL